MADNNIVTNITANADFSSLRAQLAATTAQLVKLQETTVGTNAKLGNQIAVMNKSFADTMRSTGQFSSHFVSLTDDVSKFGKNLDTGRLKLNDYYNAWQGHAKKTSTLVKDLAKQQVMMQQAIVQPLGKNAQGIMQYNIMVAKGIDELKNKTAIARQEAAIMNKVMMDGSNQLINWGKNTQWAGRQLTVGLTVPLVAFGAAASKAFREADAELVRLQKVYGGLVQTSATELAQVRKDVSATAKEIASSYGVAFKDTIALAADLAATGKQGNDLISATQQTTRLAVLGEVDRQDAMKATLAIQNAFKQNTEELTQSIDFLNAVENQTSTSLADLTEAIPKAGPVVKSLGGDVKDLALYLTAMKEGGVNASEGANAIKSAMASLINPTKVAKEMFNGFGIDIEGIVTKNAGNLTETIVGLQSALDALDPLSKSRAIEQLFGKFQYARMSALFENLGKQGSQTLQVMDLMKASASDLANISSRELTAMTESASGQYKRALASIQADLAVVGEKFLKIGTYVLKVVDGVIKFFKSLPDPIKNLLSFAGGITAIAGPLIMLTGVLGNFVGYVIKGIFHLRQMIKGGSAFKLLTPEIVAANAAAQGLSSTFYSDAEATTILSNAVNTLAESFVNLEMKANSAKVAVQPGISTLANSVLVAGGSSDARMVDKTNKYIGAPYSRQMSHFVPSGVEQPGTIFGTVPGAGPVNVRVSNNPQPYMSGDLPKVPGLTSINGVGTGIVAQEAAKWHAMTAALAMQSDAEIKLLKTEVAATGTVTTGLSQSYQTLLPEFTKITQNAAAATANIVADVQASKISVDQARAKVIALNIQVESLLAQTAASVASSMGRTASLTTVPLTGQPVVAPSGKSNMKELFHKGSTKSLVDQIARSLGGVRTSGAGYNIETTKPIKLNTGGRVYNPSRDGNVVPGDTSINYDNTPAVLQEGGFVLNQAASRNNPDLVSVAQNARNAGGKIVPAILTPGETYFPPDLAESIMPSLEKANSGSRVQLSNVGGMIGGLVSSARATYGGRPTPQQIFKMFSGKWAKAQSRRTLAIRGNRLPRHYYSTATGADVNARRMDLITSHSAGWKISRPDGTKYSLKELESLSKDEVNAIWKGVDRSHFAPAVSTNTSGQYVSPGLLGPQPRYGAGGNLSINSGGDPSTILSSLLASPIHPFATMRNASSMLGYPKVQADRYFNDAWNEVQAKLRNRTTPFGTKTDTFEEFVGNILATNLRKLKVPNTATNFYDEMSAVGTLRGRGIRGSGATVVSNSPDISFLNAGGTVGGRVRFGKKNYGVQIGERGMPMFRGRYKSPLMIHPEQQKLADKRHADMWANKPKDAEGRVWHTPLELAYMREGKMSMGKLPMPKNYYQDMSNDDPMHGALQIGRYRPPLHVRNQYVGEQIRYSSATNWRGREGINSPAFEVGTLETRAKSALYKYMQGDYSAIDDPAVQSYLSTLRTKFTGTLHRGVRHIGGLPPVISQLIQQGKWDQLVGKEFIMRRSSWSTNKDTAEGFGQLQLVADVKNRNAVPASTIFPDLTFQSAKGPVPVNENEVYMGGKFKIVAAEKNKIKLQAVYDAARENGGPVNAGRPYLVGEKGPELFVPKNSGGIIPGYALGGLVRSNKMGYGTPGNPAARAAKKAEKARRAAAYAQPEVPDREYGGGPLSVGTSTFVGNKGVKTNVRTLRGSLPYIPGLKIGNETLNGIKRAMMSVSKQIEMSMYALGTSLKKDSVAFANNVKTNAVMAGKTLKYSGMQMVVGVRMLGDQVKSSFISMGNTLKSAGIAAAGSVKNLGNKIKDSYRPGGASILQYGVPGANASGVGSSYRDPKSIPTGTKMRTAFMTNAKYSATAMAHPKQFLASRGMNVLSARDEAGNLKFGGGAVGNIAGTMGGMAAGAAIGGKLGGQNGAMMGSMVGMMAGPQLAQAAGKAVATRVAATAAASALAGGATSAGLAATAAAAAGLAAPLLAAAAAVYVGVKAWKAHNERIRIGITQFGMTEDAAKKAGLAFTDYNAKIKQTIQNAKDLRERNQLLYESMTNADTPIKMTIEQYKKLKKEVKSTYADQIKLINQSKDGDLNKVAEDLKTQLVGAGMSAEEATKKIYAMFKLSEKSSFALSATAGNKGFNAIKDAQTAAVSAVSLYASASENGGKEGAAAVQTGLTAIDTAIEDLIAKSKKAAAADKTGATQILSSYEAQQKVMAQINNAKDSGRKLTKETIDIMAEQNPEIRKFATEQDTVISLWQKMDLAAKGFSGNLADLGSKAVDALSKVARVIEEATVAANKTGILKNQYKVLDELTAKQKSLMQAAKGQSVQQQINARDAIAGLQKQIDATNKLANARKKALEDKRDAENTGRAIEAKRLELQNKEATGDTAGAQQARLELESMVKGQQYDEQIKAIDKAADAANAPKIAQIEALNKASQKQSDAAALAGESLGKLNDKIETQRGKIDAVNTAMTAFRVNAAAAGKSLEEYAKTQRGRNELAAVEAANVAAGNASGVSKGTTTQTYVPGEGMKTTTTGAKTAAQSGLDIVKATQAAIDKGMKANNMDVTNAGDIYINGKKVDAKTGEKTGTGKSFGNDTKTVTGKDLAAAKRAAIGGKQTKQFTDDVNVQYYLFKWKGKDYAVEKEGANKVHTFDVDAQTVGPVVKAGKGTNKVNPKIPTIVGDRGPEMLFGNMVIPNMGKVPYAPRFDVAKSGLQMKDSSQISGATFNVTQNIYASDGMDVEALANMVVRQTKIAIGQEAKLNAKMVGTKRT